MKGTIEMAEDPSDGRLGCPFLDLDSEGNRCKANEPAKPVSTDWQVRYCLTSCHTECRRFRQARPEEATTRHLGRNTIALVISALLLVGIGAGFALADASWIPNDGASTPSEQALDEAMAQPAEPPLSPADVAKPIRETPTANGFAGAGPTPTVPGTNVKEAASPTATPRPSPTPAPTQVAMPTPAPAPSATPAPATPPMFHTVVTGETMASVAASAGIPLSLVQAANYTLDPALLSAGAQLIVPDAAGAVPENDSVKAVHVVVDGETLAIIAARYDVSIQALATANRLADASHIEAGWALTIPKGAPPPSFIPPAPPATPAPTVAPSVVTHTVAPKETLYSIAKRYGVTIEAIMAANGLTDRTYLEIGWVLTIPAP